MAEPQVVIEWLKKADEDLEFAKSVLDGSQYFAQICFHFHQAAEKYLKAFIIATDLEFKKIHDLPVLLKLCTTMQSELQKIMDDCKFLNKTIKNPFNFCFFIFNSAICIPKLRAFILCSA